MAEDGTRWDGWLGPRQWMPIVGVLSLAVVALGLMVAFASGDDEDNDGDSGVSAPLAGGRAPTHEHADFAVVVRGEMLDFSKPEFISTPDGKELSEHVHIHDNRYTVVHVHSTLTTWDEFFRTLGFTLTDSTFAGTTAENTCLELPDGEKLCNTATERWSFVANGVPVDGLASVNIGDLDRVLFSYGPETPEDARDRYYGLVTDQACIPSELCVERIPADEPVETCSGRGACGK